MKTLTLRATASAATLLASSLAGFSVHAQDTQTESATVPTQAEASVKMAEAAAQKAIDSLGLKFWGYMRSGAYGSTKGEPKGQYQLSGNLDHYRLGNEGDNYLEFGIGKKFDLGGGLKWGTYWMPTYYNGATNTAQIYTDMTGIEGLQGATVWAGQRYHRIQDVHVIDNWLMEDGDNYGAGVDDLQVGFGTLNVAAYTQGSSANQNTDYNNGKRINVQWHDMPVNPGGTLTLTGAYLRGNYADKNNGYALGALHNQKDFLVQGLINSLFLQTSTGHADVRGKFYNADTSAILAKAGARQSRIVESINWQVGKFGGQALVGYMTVKPDTVAGKTDPQTKDLSFGGRVTYGVARNIKAEGEIGFNNLKTDNAGTQNLNKETVAIAFAPNTDFWTRPEFRVYLQRAGWNRAAQIANVATFGQNGRTNAVSFGAQVEAWW